jgi:formylglycine-generating enzyme required for sulfatase activity
MRPGDELLAFQRADLLDSLAVREHGMVFRYVPGRCYRIGSENGDPDERPVHTVKLRPFWISNTPISWAAFCALTGWPAPPQLPSGELIESMASHFENVEEAISSLSVAMKVRLQYCEDATASAGLAWRSNRGRPRDYDLKPMVAVNWHEAEYLAQRLSRGHIIYRLPTEAEWEAAARGGLMSARYPWGNNRPTRKRCDFNRFHEFSVQQSRFHRPNGYGLYAMSGGVWEWTSDWYDALYYDQSPRNNPTGPAKGMQRVLRGGSWTDPADVLTVSFRMSRRDKVFEGASYDDWARPAANVGFRLCRLATSSSD